MAAGAFSLVAESGATLRGRAQASPFGGFSYSSRARALE